MNRRDLLVAGGASLAYAAVANPAIDAEGNIFVTFSGSRGQKVPVSVYKIDSDFNGRHRQDGGSPGEKPSHSRLGTIFQFESKGVFLAEPSPDGALQTLLKILSNV